LPVNQTAGTSAGVLGRSMLFTRTILVGMLTFTPRPVKYVPAGQTYSGSPDVDPDAVPNTVLLKPFSVKPVILPSGFLSGVASRGRIETHEVYWWLERRKSAHNGEADE
jgi:hypothetical protein